MASWLVYFKYQMVNSRMLNIYGINNKDVFNDWFIMDKNLFLFIANIFQACVSFLIAKFLYGRRIQVIYVLIALVALTEVIFYFYYILNESTEPSEKPDVDPLQMIFLIKATLVYILYFMVCRFSIIDIAKVESLSSNARLCGSFLCLTIASQLII